MAGMFLPFAGFGKQPVNAVTARGGQLVFGTPDFPQDEVAFGRFNRIVLQCLHTLDAEREKLGEEFLKLYYDGDKSPKRT